MPNSRACLLLRVPDSKSCAPCGTLTLTIIMVPLLHNHRKPAVALAALAENHEAQRELSLQDVSGKVLRDLQQTISFSHRKVSRTTDQTHCGHEFHGGGYGKTKVGMVHSDLSPPQTPIQPANSRELIGPRPPPRGWEGL